MTNRKSHTRFRLVPKSTTLDDLEGPLHTLFQNRFQRNGYSGLFKVTYFGVDAEPTRYYNYILQCNDVGLISKASGYVCDRKHWKIAVFDHSTLLSFDAPSPGNPVNICTNFILPETRVPTTFCPYSMGLLIYLHSNFCDGLQNMFWKQSMLWPFKVIQGRWIWRQSKAGVRLPISDQ